MKPFLAQGFAAILLMFLPLCACAERVPSVDRQDLVVTLVPEQHLLIGESRIFFSGGSDRVNFTLSPDAEVNSVSVNGVSIPFIFDQGILSLKLPPGSHRHPVAIGYRARFDDPVATNPMSSEDPTYGVNAAITENGTFLGSGSGWYPVPESVPGYRTVQVKAPPGVEAITFGKLACRNTTSIASRSVWEEAHPVGELSLSAGNYEVAESKVDGIDLYTYFYPENARLAQDYLDAAARYLKLYVELFGPYPFEKFAVVENFFPTGYGMPSYTLLGSTVIRLPFIIDTSFPHEIAHSWWGNGVEIARAEGNWCEGLVTYLADYYLKERRSAAEAEQYRRQTLADFAQLVTPERDFPLTRFMSRVDPSSRAIGYGKTSMVFHMIRTRIGDEAFFEALRDVARQHMYASASWSDFIAAFSLRSGVDLTPFVRQWLTRTGGPRLALSGVTSKQQGKGWVVKGKITQTPAFRDLAVPLRLETTAGSELKKVNVDREQAAFTIASDAQPVRLTLDSKADLFRRLDPSEIPVTVNSIKGSRSVVAVRTRNCPVSADSFRKLLESLDQKAATVIGEEALKGALLKENDLVFCGVPEDRSLIGRFPKGTALSAGAFTVEGKPFTGPDALLFLVTPRPSSQRVSALFQPLSEAAAEKYAYKITHYGKFGYLVFSEGSNRLKGTLPAASGSSVVDFQ